jgi:5-methyltetrahydrofolate--homocysteine methyltransferase
MTIMRTMDGIRRGTRARRLDAAARGSNGNGHGSTRRPVEVDRAAFPDRATRLALDGGEASARFRELVDSGGPILADGAMGTMLFGAGLQFGDPPEVWNLTQPEVIRRIHRGYLEAGSQILMTNTFGGNRLRLGLHGLAARVDDLNRTAAILLRAEVEAAGGTALVAGDIGPSGEIVEPLGTLPYAEAVDVFREQAASLVAGGADLIWIETMSDLSEIKAAIEGVRQAAPGIALVATMTFDTRGHTMMGVTPEQAVEALAAWGADAIGGNCGNGPDELIPVIAKMHATAPDVVLVAKSNAGMPELVDMRAVYRADPETMATQVVAMRDAGATIVGGCCGSTPDHLRAIAGAVAERT